MSNKIEPVVNVRMLGQKSKKIIVIKKNKTDFEIALNLVSFFAGLLTIAAAVKYLVYG